MVIVSSPSKHIGVETIGASLAHVCLIVELKVPQNIKNKVTGMMSFAKLKSFCHLVEVLFLQPNDKESH